MFENLDRFAERAIRERDWLMQAVNTDKRDAKYQAKIANWSNGFFPIGRTGRLLARLRPSTGYSKLDQAYQAAIAEAISAGLGAHLLPKLEEAIKAHEALLGAAKRAYERSLGTESFRCFTAHCEAFNALIHIINSQPLGHQHRELPAGSGGSMAAGAPTGDPVAVTLLTSWREVLIALRLRNNKEDQSKVKKLNKDNAGPIVIQGQGHQPKVNKAKLIEWWNGLEQMFEDGKQRQRDAQATTAEQHAYGKTGTVVPDIVGEVRKRRKDRKE